MNSKVNFAVAKKNDGNIEITFTVPADLISSTKIEVLKEFTKDATIPGFRKGMAPVAKVEENISSEKLTEKILSHILPKAFSDVIIEQKVKPAMYPKFEAIKIEVGKDWEIKATTCEIPEINLGDYKKQLKKDEKDENVLIKSLIDAVKVEIPRMLIDEEVNGRLSQVLERIEKLGLSLEGYLKSVGKTPESLRAEYEIQSKNAISLEIILNKIADQEKIEISEAQIDEFIKTTGSKSEDVDKEKRDILKRVLLRRSALDNLTKDAILIKKE